jgi:DNA helicase-2/ATP-dependent DNA helicase PcrA
MTIERVRAALRSDERTVIVDAPAGCGKTFEAAHLATDLAAALPPGREVLLLAHTNAAVQEFARRTQRTRRAVRVSTIDSFCLQMLEPYASALHLPVPLRRHVGLGANRLRFDELAPKALELLTRCGALARILGLHYSVIILDEHQDARPDQHAVIRRIADAGASRVRIFGDPMQAIFDRGPGGSIDWQMLVRENGGAFELDTPHRWREVPRLGEWIMAARHALRTDHALPIDNRPESVRITRIAGMPDPKFGRGLPQFLSRPLHGFLNRCNTTTAVLTHANRMACDIHVCVNGRVVVNEGADFEAAYAALDSAKAAIGEPRGLALVLLNMLHDVSTGLNKSRHDALTKLLGADTIAPTKSRELFPIMSALHHLYHQPTIAGFCEAVTSVHRNPPNWLSVRLPETLRMLGRIRPPDDSPLEALDNLVALRKLHPPRPRVTVSTVHKAKGLEFDHVGLCPFSTTLFPDTEYGRRLTYVAISRACRTIELLVPAQGMSPLLGARMVEGPGTTGRATATTAH